MRWKKHSRMTFGVYVLVCFGIFAPHWYYGLVVAFCEHFPQNLESGSTWCSSKCQSLPYDYRSSTINHRHIRQLCSQFRSIGSRNSMLATRFTVFSSSRISMRRPFSSLLLCATHNPNHSQNKTKMKFQSSVLSVLAITAWNE